MHSWHVFDGLMLRATLLEVVCHVVVVLWLCCGCAVVVLWMLSWRVDPALIGDWHVPCTLLPFCWTSCQLCRPCQNVVYSYTPPLWFLIGRGGNTADLRLI